MGALQKRVMPGIPTDPDVFLYATWISVWGRWFIWLVCVFLLAYRPGSWYPESMEFLAIPVLLFAANGLVHHRLLTHRPVTWRWLLFLGAMDVVLITVGVFIGGGFRSFIFLFYYPAMAVFAVAFSSYWLSLAWTTTAAVAYVVVCLVAGLGLDLGASNEKVLVTRLAVMYTIVVGINLITRFERTRWHAAVARERERRQERIELSQTIHDTIAQTAYMIGLGIHNARQLAGESNRELAAALDATLELSRSAMWEMRGPIDAGHLVEGRELGRVLWSHCATFEKITGVPSELSQSGTEPPLSHRDPDPSLLHRPQRPDQRLPARPARQRQGQPELRGPPDQALRLGRRRGPARRLRGTGPRLQRDDGGSCSDGRNAHR